MTSAHSTKPEPKEHNPYYGRYVALVPDGDIIGTLARQIKETVGCLEKVTENQANTRHAPYTWSLKEVVGHLSDTERVFQYRALCISRKDATPLPGFDENEYARAGHFDRLPWKDLVADFDAVRLSTLALFKNLEEEAWTRTGTANNNLISVRSLAFIIAGHELHHVGIVRKRLANE